MVPTRIAAPPRAVKPRTKKASTASTATPAAVPPRRPQEAPATNVGETPNPPPAEPSGAAPAPLAQLTRADLLDLREQLEDLAAVALDATARPALRRLGRFTARRTALAAYRKALQLFTLAGETRHG